MLKVNAIDHLVFNVRDVEVSAAWYVRVLGMERHDAQSPRGDTRTSMTFGSMKINLRPLTVSQEDWFTADHPEAGGQDLCFLTDMAPDDVVAHFRGLGVAIIAGPTNKSGARGTIRSVYIRDPDGSLVEVSSYA
ncbi:VOC family protein [Sphingopyxis sp. DBS4]|uniref:VOC family protein n=1 Tax=Sphingopyxis sp. DBS4 TaxID=2968500 RepID=UPI00214AC909|nr:VOC family protein [Sphingopyxis sp. DBS4]